MKGPWKKDEFEGIEYEPTSVKELLTEMKDVSELIVDLASSAVLIDSREIGEEVRHLESKMDKLKYQIRLASMLADRTVDESEQLTGILQVASAAETIANAAAWNEMTTGHCVPLVSALMMLVIPADAPTPRAIPTTPPRHESKIDSIRN